jgi:glycosyltransferase involved in cell wall biosynthesis
MSVSQQMTLSVALTTYNGAEFLEQQLHSLAEQKTLPHELVVCDDQSTDATADVIEAFAKVAPFKVTFVRNPKNLGWRANFLKAASMCDGDLVAFCDQDDIWYPDKIRRILSEFSSETTLACFHDADLIDRQGSVYGALLTEGDYPSIISPLSRPFTWSNPLGLTLTFRRDLLRFSGLWPSSVDRWSAGKQAAHDQWFFFLAVTLGNAKFIPDKLLAYRQHGGNTVGWAPKSGWSRYPKGLQETNQQLIDHLAMENSFISIFEKAVEMPELAQHRQALEKAIEQHSLLARRLSARSKLYSSRLGGRLSGLLELLRGSAYSRADPWKFGMRDMVVDCLLAAPFSPMFQYLGQERKVART